MTATAFLSDSEVRRLTGTPVKAEQIAFLREQGIRHWGPNRAGKIIVPRAAVEGGSDKTSAGWSPDFGALRA